MNKNPFSYIFATLFGVMLILTLIDKISDDELALYNSTVEKQFREKILSLERQLTTTQQQRDSLNHSFDNLNRDHEALVRVDSAKTEALKSIPGKFKNLTTKQLEDEMLKRYAEAHPHR